jgi:hypothetical protein
MPFKGSLVGIRSAMVLVILADAARTGNMDDALSIMNSHKYAVEKIRKLYSGGRKE